MEKEFLIQSPRDYLTWLLHILCIHNQNRLLFKGNPISNGFNLEKQQKANKSSEAGPRKALWLLHVWRPDPVERFGRAASLSSEFAVLRDVGWAPGRLLANFCPGINYTDCVPVWAKLGIIEMLALLTDLIFGKRVWRINCSPASFYSLFTTKLGLWQIHILWHIWEPGFFRKTYFKCIE